jgi:general secretion pathway protein H
MRAHAGFTLIELLVTLLVLGIAASGAGVLVEHVRARDPEAAVLRLKHALERATTLAEIRGRQLAIEFVVDGYHFAELDPQGEWLRVDTDPGLSPQRLPEGLTWTGLRIGESGPLSSPLHRRISFGSRGPRYRLQLEHDGKLHNLDGDIVGRVHHTRASPD